MTQLDWNDLKYFAAVAQHGSTVAAARALGVNQSTVQRRVAELQRQIGHALVERHPGGYRLTPFAEALRPQLQHLSDAAQALQQQMVAAEREAVGVIRVTCPEPIVYRIAQTALLERFRAQYPGLRVEFLMSDAYLDLAKGEADIAMRSGDVEDSDLIGRKIGDSLWAVYASRDYVAQHGAAADAAALAQHQLIGFDDSMAKHRAAQWLAHVAPNAHVAARNNSVLGMLYSVKAGMGVAPLPLALGEAEADLVKLFGPVPELTRIWRVLARRDLRRTPRVAAFFDFIVGEIDTLKPIFSG